jgi:hypothetical protein
MILSWHSMGCVYCMALHPHTLISNHTHTHAFQERLLEGATWGPNKRTREKEAHSHSYTQAPNSYKHEVSFTKDHSITLQRPRTHTQMKTQ